MRHRPFRLLPLALLLTSPGYAEPEHCAPDTMIVFDGSGSMAEMGFNDIGEPRIFEARRAVREVVPAVSPLRRLGLIIYGPGAGESCAGIDLRFTPEADAGHRIVTEIETLEPGGETALTEAVALAAQTLNADHEPGVIVLVTDGKETCGGATCQLAAELAASSHDLTVHVIGFKVRGDRFSFGDDSDYKNASPVAQCLAERTGGLYRNTETADELIAALRETLGCQFLM